MTYQARGTEAGPSSPGAGEAAPASAGAPQPDPVRAALLEIGRCERVPRNAVVWHDGMDEVPCGMVLEGLLRQQHDGRDGCRRIVNLILPGETVSPANVVQSGITTEAATPVVLLRVAPRDFDRLERGMAALGAHVFRDCEAQIDRLRWLTWAVLALGTEARICAFLDCAADMLTIASTPEGRPVLNMMLNRRDIADMLGTSVETVCRVLKRLDREGVIRMHAPARLEIRDRAALRARGQGGQDCPLSSPSLSGPSLSGPPAVRLPGDRGRRSLLPNARPVMAKE